MSLDEENVPKRDSSWLRWASLLAVGVAAIMWAGIAVLSATGSVSFTSWESAVGPGAAGKAENLSQAFRTAAKRALPAVVVIKTSKKAQPIEDVYMDQPFSRRGFDGQQFPATIERTDSGLDLAVLRVKCETPLPAAKLGDSETLEIGDWVLAVGSPFELEQTVSAGIVSAKGRSLDSAGSTRLLQTDAAINPGSSGGALVNLAGEVVGITTAIASRSGGYQGIAFAVPINLAKQLRDGKPSQPSRKGHGPERFHSKPNRGD